MSKRALQIGHSPRAPHGGLCAAYARVLTDLGYQVDTLFLVDEIDAELQTQFPGSVASLELAEGALAGLKLSARAQLRDALQRLGFDASNPVELLVTHRYKPFYLAMMLGSTLQRPAWLALAHEYRFLRGRRRWLRRLFASHAVLVGVSKPVRDELRAHGGEPAAVLPNVLDLARLSEKKKSINALRQEYGVDENDFVFACVGRLADIKQPELVLDAFLALKQSLKNADATGAVKLVFVGDGPLREVLAQRVAQENLLTESVLIAGHRPDVSSEYHAFDAAILNASRREAFGMPILEAAIGSCALIVADAPGPMSVLDVDRKAYGNAQVYLGGDRDSLVQSMRAALPGQSGVAAGAAFVQQNYSLEALRRSLPEVIAQAEGVVRVS